MFAALVLAVAGMSAGLDSPASTSGRWKLRLRDGEIKLHALRLGSYLHLSRSNPANELAPFPMNSV